MGVLHQVRAQLWFSTFLLKRGLTEVNPSLPIGGVAICLLMIALPLSFGSDATKQQQQQHQLSRTNLLRIDLVGAVLLLAGSFPLITALNEVNVQFRWSDRATIVLLVISGIAWIAFLAWEHFITDAERRPAPIFPTQFLVHRPWMGMLL